MNATAARRAIAVLLSAAVVIGCGSSVEQPPPTLAAAAVPYLASSVKRLTAAHLAREAGEPGLAGRLRQWGYTAGADRYFQGESHRLQVVDSRTLRFRRPLGATSYVTFMRSHLNPILGSFPKVSGYRAGSRTGILAVGQECQCHLANPTFLAVVVRGATVSWLEINGPAATRRRLATLLGRAP